ncbi:DUF2894 domain-containing protein [Paraburkholderia sp.]|uniref:DUF2894 domain-containing protein n=1 Tax=Paraburkholderia sp. TaxID=1926495 RepID=UPI00286F4966|nr:DUF2894 domain-containing protein [Paraburkholderia sp.]
MSDGTPIVASARTTLDAWREQGADRLDTVRYALIDALEKRASAHEGAARAVLDARIDTLIADYAAKIEQAASQHARADDVATQDPQRALASLAADASRDARNGPPADLLDYFRDVWSKLSADQQVQQSLDQVPKNAGPLNSSSLVHRALLLMRELSPGYLRQFLAYADALSWIEDLNGGAAPAAKEAPRASAAKKTTRSRAK